jgi:heme-degrading monooxygenase HmoA
MVGEGERAVPDRRVAMHARVSTYQTDNSDRLIEGFESVSGELEQMDGFSHAYFMVDRGSGKALSVTIWESEDALRGTARRRTSCGKRAPNRAARRSSRSITTRSRTRSALKPPPARSDIGAVPQLSDPV